VFVYFLVWLRSEWFGISLRLMAIGVFLVAISGGGLSALLLFALFAVLIAMQLKELEGVYRNYEWTRMYPLPTGLRGSSVRLVRFVLHAAAVVALAVPLGWHAIHGDLWAGLLADGVLFAGVVVGSVAGSFLYHRLRKAG
jgi:ABC-2 type transport system permease protein